MLVAPASATTRPPALTAVTQLAESPAADTPPGDIDESELDRMLCQDLADYDEDPDVRIAAQKALDTGDPVRIRDFLDNGLPVYRRAADANRKERAAENRALVQQWAQTGGPIVRQRATAVLATGNDAKISDFVTIGKAAAEAADAQDELNAAAQAKLIRARVQQIVAQGGYEVAAAGQAALDSDDPAVIADFYNDGYKIASAHDTDAQQQIEAALAARAQAVSDVADLAQRSARAATAQKQIITESVTATQYLTVTSNSMGLTNRYAKRADAIYAADLPIRKAGGATRTADLTKLRSDTCAESATTARNADQVKAHAAVAGTAADTLTATGLTHGIEWAEVVRAQSDAGDAAKQAAETACHAAEATEAAAKTLDADHNATVDAANAVKYRQAAQREQAAAEKLADRAEQLAAAAKAAAADAKAQRLRAEKDAATARSRADDAKADYERARRQRDVAKQATADAIEHQRQAYDAASRAIAQQNIAVTKHDDAKQAYDTAIAAATRFQSVGDRAKNLIERAQASATNAKSKELEAEAAEARALAIETACKYPDNPDNGCPGTADMNAARDAATRIRADATAARGAADSAKTDASAASAAADAAAADSRRAAAAAAAAASAARAAANEARQAHQAATDAVTAATKAIKDAEKADKDARAAVNTARAAMNHAEAARQDAVLTRQAAEDGQRQAALASFQSRVAGRAALDARTSAAAIVNPAEQAMDAAAAYAATDNDAAMAIDIASAAMLIGDEQSTAAQQHADDAAAASVHAAEMAAAAEAQVKPAFEAAQKAAAAAERAVKASQAAVAAAKAAAEEARGAINAAEDAMDADKQAAYYANAAGQMAAEAGQNAGVARMAANSAAGYATKAHTAWQNADGLAGDTEKMRDTATKLSDSMWAIARGMSGLADTLETAMWQAYHAEQEAAETAWIRWLQEKSDAAVNKLPASIRDIARGGADSLIGTVGGIWYLSNCTVGSFLGTTAAGDEHTVPDVSIFPSSDKACDVLADGLKGLMAHPEELIHWKEWQENWKYALGMTLVDVITIAGTDGIGAIGKALKEGITADLSKLLSRDLLSGAAKWGTEKITAAIGKLGALNTARLIELSQALTAKLTFDADEIAAMATSIGSKGIDAVEQALKDLRDLPVIKGLEDLVKACLRIGGNSFAADTRVLLAGGGTARIADIRAGDHVLATDPRTGRTVAEPVLATMVNDDTALTDLTIGQTVVHTTAEHPFWTPRGWTDAGDLTPGTVLSAAARVTAVHNFTGAQAMYNLTVAELHTYYVLAGVPVLVHNAGVGCLEGQVEYVVKRKDGSIISDVDRFEDDVLWEYKDGIPWYGDEEWLVEQIDGKFAKYLEMRENLPDFYRNAPIGFRFPNPKIDAKTRQVITDRLRKLGEQHGVDVRIEFAS